MSESTTFKIVVENPDGSARQPSPGPGVGAAPMVTGSSGAAALAQAAQTLLAATMRLSQLSQEALERTRTRRSRAVTQDFDEGPSPIPFATSMQRPANVATFANPFTDSLRRVGEAFEATGGKIRSFPLEALPRFSTASMEANRQLNVALTNLQTKFPLLSETARLVQQFAVPQIQTAMQAGNVAARTLAAFNALDKIAGSKMSLSAGLLNLLTPGSTEKSWRPPLEGQEGVKAGVAEQISYAVSQALLRRMTLPEPQPMHWRLNPKDLPAVQWLPPQHFEVRGEGETQTHGTSRIKDRQPVPRIYERDPHKDVFGRQPVLPPSLPIDAQNRNKGDSFGVPDQQLPISPRVRRASIGGRARRALMRARRGMKRIGSLGKGKTDAQIGAMIGGRIGEALLGNFGKVAGMALGASLVEVSKAAAKNREQLGAAYGGSELGMGAAVGQVFVDLARSVPVLGLAVKAAETAMDFLSAAARQGARNIQVMGAISADVARNELIAAQSRGLEKQIAETGMLNIFGQLRLVTNETREKLAGLQAFGQMRAALTQQMQQVGAYSPEISMAMARGQVTQIRADMREAERLGGAYARFSEAQSNWQAAVQAALEPEKRRQLEEITALLARPQGSTIEDIKSALAGMNDDAIMKAIRDKGEEKKLLQRIADELKLIREQNQPDFGQSILDGLAQGARRMVDRNQGADPVMNPWWRPEMNKPLGF